LGRESSTWGVGITVQLTPDNNGDSTLAAGPAIALEAKHGKWTFGLFNQNFVSDTFKQTQLQPILGYAFNHTWSVEIGDAQYTYDWVKDRVTSIPLSGQLNRIVSVEDQRIHLFFRTQYNLKQEQGSDKWTFVAGISFVVEQFG
jgi:hypothetical protein